MLNNQNAGFNPIQILGLIIGCLGLGWGFISDSNDAFMMAIPAICLMVGLFLINKGREKPKY